MCLGAVLIAGAIPAAYAHDFWIEPGKFRPASGERVAIHLFVGEHFKGEPVLFAPEQYERFVAAGPNGERAIEGRLGDDFGTVVVKEPGRYVVGYFSRKFDVTFDNVAEFEKYLKTEGLERHIPLARRRASLRSGILEIYTRCAKSLLQVGSGETSPDRVLGFPLELIAETDTYAGARELRVQLRYRGKPLQGALVVASNKRAPLDKQRVHTDKDGRAVFDLKQPGIWLITSVHMIPAALLSRADWESFWASLTFELPR